MPQRQSTTAAAAAIARAFVAVVGGYAVAALAVAGLAPVLARVGMAPSDAVVAAAMAGFIGYLALLMWALACHRLGRLAGVLACAAAVFALVAWAARLGPAP